MNFTKNALVLVTAIAIVAIYTAYTWCNELVAVSLLKTVELPTQPQIAKYRSANKTVKVKPDYAALTLSALKRLRFLNSPKIELQRRSQSASTDSI